MNMYIYSLSLILSQTHLSQALTPITSLKLHCTNTMTAVLLNTGQSVVLFLFDLSPLHLIYLTSRYYNLLVFLISYWLLFLCFVLI